MRKRFLLSSAALLLGLLPSLASACACGCGVFDVGTSSMIPNGAGGMAYFEYDFLDQTHNWNGNSSASGNENTDKLIRSQFLTVGAEYMFNRDWGVNVQVPYTQRYFKNTDDDDGTLESFRHGAFGDVRLEGIYSGFSADMSSGLIFGTKLPTGDYNYANFDRDVEIGSGSTDLLLGGYHEGTLTQKAPLNWFVQALWDHPVITTAGYRPGDEIDAATGVYYEMGKIGPFTRVSPLLQLIGSQRWRDEGANADPDNSGYSRLLISPGIEATLAGFTAYADVELPIYQHTNGDQLVAPALLKVIIGHPF